MLPIHPHVLPFAIQGCLIEDYRAFAHADIRFGSTNLIVGINGAGKTTVLRACSLLLEDVVRRIGPRTSAGRRLSPFDFREEEDIVLFHGLIVENSKTYIFRRGWGKIDQRVSELRPLTKTEAEASELASQYWDALESGTSITLPLLCFYPVDRMVTDVPLRIRKETPLSRRDAYTGAFTSERNFRNFFQWFREQEDIENEQRIPDPHLSSVRRAIEKAMPGYTNLRVSRRPRLRMLIDKGGETLAIQQLSDGEQGVLALIGDIARRASILNPHLKDPLESPGCILVDEIDQHLHPQWQRHVVQTLRSIFPNLQFVFSSHSPIVCGSVEPDSLIVLRDGHAESGSVYGWSMAAILKAVFDIDERPPAIHKQLVELDRAMDDLDVATARRTMASLQTQLPSDDPEIVRGNVILPMIEAESRA